MQGKDTEIRTQQQYCPLCEWRDVNSSHLPIEKNINLKKSEEKKSSSTQMTLEKQMRFGVSALHCIQVYFTANTVASSERKILRTEADKIITV